MERHRVLVTSERFATAAKWIRDRVATAAADIRGIALQTVIIMVVLVVIGGAVAAVLVNRSGSEIERLEDTDITIDASKYKAESLCEMAGHTWNSSDVCVPTTSTTTTTTTTTTLVPSS